MNKMSVRDQRETLSAPQKVKPWFQQIFVVFRLKKSCRIRGCWLWPLPHNVGPEN